MLGSYAIGEAPIGALPAGGQVQSFVDVAPPLSFNVNSNRTWLDLAPSETFIDIVRSYTYIDLED